MKCKGNEFHTDIPFTNRKIEFRITIFQNWNKPGESVRKSIMHIFNRVSERAKSLSVATWQPYFKCVWDIVHVLSMHRRADFDDLCLIIALVNVLFTVRSFASWGPFIFFNLRSISPKSGFDKHLNLLWFGGALIWPLNWTLFLILVIEDKISEIILRPLFEKQSLVRSLVNK